LPLVSHHMAGHIYTFIHITIKDYILRKILYFIKNNFG